MSIYQKMKLPLLEQGKFLVTAAVEFQKLQTSVLEHRKIFPKAKTKGKLTIEIMLESSEEDEKLFIVTTQVKVTRPGRPPSSTVALVDEDENGDGLFVGTAGSREDDPRQRTFGDALSDTDSEHPPPTPPPPRNGGPQKGGDPGPETVVAVDDDGNPV